MNLEVCIQIFVYREKFTWFRLFDKEMFFIEKDNSKKYIDLFILAKVFNLITFHL